MKMKAKVMKRVRSRQVTDRRTSVSMEAVVSHKLPGADQSFLFPKVGSRSRYELEEKYLKEIMSIPRPLKTAQCHQVPRQQAAGEVLCFQ